MANWLSRKRAALQEDLRAARIRECEEFTDFSDVRRYGSPRYRILLNRRSHKAVASAQAVKNVPATYRTLQAQLTELAVDPYGTRDYKWSKRDGWQIEYKVDRRDIFVTEVWNKPTSYSIH